jgi:hypothetical protein
MDAFINALVELIRRDGNDPDGVRPIKADLSGAPASVRALAEALASSRYSIELGGFDVDSETGPVATLAAAFEMSAEAGIEDLDGLLATAGPGGQPLVIARTLLLAYDGGGMSALGVTWAGGAANLVIVEMEDPTEDNLVRAMATPAAAFELLDLVSRGEKAEDLETLRAAFMPAPVAPPAPPPSRLGAWTGAAQPHPFAHARAQYPKGNVLQSAPTAGGAVLVTRRVAAGTVTAALAVHTAGTTTELDWPATADVPGFGPVPGRERMLVHVGAMAGNLVELDLASGAQRAVLEKVDISSGFVDADHLAVLANREVRVYRWSDGALGEPVATVPAPTLYNIFVAHGCVIGKTSDYKTTTVRILRWNGASLDDLGEHAVEPKLFMFHAATIVDGAPVVASVDMKGGAYWFRLDAG